MVLVNIQTPVQPLQLSLAVSRAMHTIKGSARSIPGFHIRDALDAIATANPGLIEKFGGHAKAAGLSIPMHNFEAFRTAFNAEAQQQLSPESLEQVVLTDGELTPDQFTLGTAQLLADSGPWGQAFPEPSFDGVFKLLEQRIVGSRHLKMLLGIANSNQIIDGIAFNVDLDQWPNKKVKEARIAYQLDINEYRGRQSVQILASHLEALE